MKEGETIGSFPEFNRTFFPERSLPEPGEKLIYHLEDKYNISLHDEERDRGKNSVVFPEEVFEGQGGYISEDSTTEKVVKDTKDYLRKLEGMDVDYTSANECIGILHLTTNEEERYRLTVSNYPGKIEIKLQNQELPEINL